LMKDDETREIVIASYDPRWPQLYIGEALRLSSVLGEQVASIHHVGGTSVHGMCARPVIDILVEVRDFEGIERYHPPMRAYGYMPLAEASTKTVHVFFRENEEGIRTHKILLVREGDDDVRRLVLLRNFLAENPEEAKEYCALKEELARRYGDDPEKYEQGKADYIVRIQEKLDE